MAGTQSSEALGHAQGEETGQGLSLPQQGGLVCEKGDQEVRNSSMGEQRAYSGLRGSQMSLR